MYTAQNNASVSSSANYIFKAFKIIVKTQLLERDTG